jgi:hypothetical protein
MEAWLWDESPYMIDEGDDLYSYPMVEGLPNIIFFCDQITDGVNWQTTKCKMPPSTLYETPIYIQSSIGYNGIWGDYKTKTLKLFIQDSY